MARTTSTLVAGVIEWDDTIPLDPFIDSANVIVTDCCTGEKGPTPAYSDDRLEIIERWLAAHFYAVRDRRAAYEQAGPVAAKYENFLDAGLATTMYGSQAMLMDTNGGLAALNAQITKGKSNKVGLYWMGKTNPAEAKDWQDS